MLKKKANQIIVIMTDTQRTDMLGCYGNKDMDTPNLDQLAEQGMLFEQVYCAQPVCGPARSALFTGQFPHSNGSWGNTMPLNNMTRHLGERMEEAGYHTGYIGKWHLDGGDYFGYAECPEGWDPEYWYDMRTYLEELSEEDRVRSRKFETSYDKDFSEDFTYAHRCSDKAIEFLEKNKDKDFLLVVSYDEPHDPSLCPPEYIEKYKGYHFNRSENVQDTLEDKPEHHRIWAGSALDEDREGYRIEKEDLLGCNSFVDYEIGRVLKAIDKYSPDSLLIYTSDHGCALHSHRIEGKGPAMYDEITRVPFIVRWSKVIDSDQTYAYPVSHIDVVPTILEVAGVEGPKLLEGKSLLPAFAEGERVNEEVFMEFGRYEIDHDGFGGFQPVRAVCNGRYKLVVNLLTSDELYDLEEDPAEMKNLINDEEKSEIRDVLHDRLLDWMNDTRDPFRGYYWERRPWRKDAREATWDYTAMTRQRQGEADEKIQLDYTTGLDIKEPVRHKEVII